MSRHSDLTYDILSKLLSRGLTANRIALLLNTTRPTVTNTCLKKWPDLYEKLRDNGRRLHGRGNMKVSLEACLADYRAGMSRQEIAAKHGVCWQAVHNHLVRCGVVERKKSL